MSDLNREIEVEIENVELATITTMECDPFEGKSLEMLKCLLNNCDSMEIRININNDLELTFYKEKWNPVGEIKK